MSHEIEVNGTGTANAFYVGEPAWHRLGRVFPETELTIPAAIVAAGLNWKVRLQPLHMRYDGEDLPIPGGYATVRDSDKSILGVVGQTYRPLQNEDAFNWFQPFLDAKAASLEAAGSLREGKRVWILAKIKGDPMEVVKNDPIIRYVLLSNGHDGTMAIRAGFTDVRVVCANTLAGAHNSGASKLLRIRHTAGSTRSLKEVSEIMDLANKEFVARVDQLKNLARKGVSVEDLKSYVRKVFEVKVSITSVTNEVEVEEEKNERLINKIIPLFEKGRGNDLPGVRGTAWAAYNAVTEYLQYERGNDNNRLDSMWFGDSARLNQKAFQVAMAMAG
jgi:phage/plasmid-like protein (TIGR03299 family)